MKLAFALLVAIVVVGGASAPVMSQSVDTSAGRKRAEVCMACHGEDGRSKTPGTPHLVDQDREYLMKALRAYRIGETRRDETMTAMAKVLSDADIINIAAYFSGLDRSGR